MYPCKADLETLTVVLRPSPKPRLIAYELEELIVKRCGGPGAKASVQPDIERTIEVTWQNLTSRCILVTHMAPAEGTYAFIYKLLSRQGLAAQVK